MGLSVAAAGLAAAALAFSQRCLRVLDEYRFDRFKVCQDWNDEVDWEDDTSEPPLGVSSWKLYLTEPQKLRPVERWIWGLLNLEERWLAVLGGIEGGNFSRRMAAALGFLLGGCGIYWIGESLAWDKLSLIGRWCLLPWGALAVPWSSTTTVRWVSTVAIAPGISAPEFFLRPIALRTIVGLRAKEIVVKAALAAPVLALGIWLIRDFPKISGSDAMVSFLRLLPPLFVAQLILFSVTFAHAIMVASMGARARGRGPRAVIHLVLVLQLALAAGALSGALVPAAAFGFAVVIAIALAVLGLANGLLLAYLIRWRLGGSRFDLVQENE